MRIFTWCRYGIATTYIWYAPYIWSSTEYCNLHSSATLLKLHASKWYRQIYRFDKYFHFTLRRSYKYYVHLSLIPSTDSYISRYPFETIWIPFIVFKYLIPIYSTSSSTSSPTRSVPFVRLTYSLSTPIHPHLIISCPLIQYRFIHLWFSRSNSPDCIYWIAACYHPQMPDLLYIYHIRISTYPQKIF